MRYFVCLLLVCSGCLDGGAPDDMSMILEDLSGGGTMPDLEKADLTGLLNCAALDKAEAMCNANNATCVSELRKMATPTAVVKDEALQQCFHTNCPLNGVCTPDPGGNYSQACKDCVNNTLQSSGTSCTPPNGMGCQKCYNDGQVCLNDG
jgi:hypothetical protein